MTGQNGPGGSGPAKGVAPGERTLPRANDPRAIVESVPSYEEAVEFVKSAFSEREPDVPSERDDVTTLTAELERREAAAGPHRPTVSSQWTFALFAPPNASVHDGFPAVESPSPAFTPLGQGMAKHKLTGTKVRKVLHRRKGVVMMGHDVGPILHAVLCPEPATAVALSALAFGLASRKCMFGAQNIMLEKGGPIGSCMLTNWPPTPMLFCGDPIPIPFGCAPFSRFNTVSFSMSRGDYLLGFALIAADIVVSLAFSAISDAVGTDDPSLTEAQKAAENAIVGLILHSPQSTATSIYETAAIGALAEPGMETEVVWLDMHVWSFATTREKSDDGGWKEPEGEAEDANARYSWDLTKWGEVL